MLCAGLLVYSQTLAYFGNEGFYLLAAQLVLAGKRPYVDFFYQHAPLGAYLTAGWMALVGNSWRSAHVMSALSTAGAIGLAADFVRVRFPEPAWRTAGAVVTALLIGLNPLVIRFGTIGQAYGVCLLLSVAAFRLTVAAAERREAMLLSLGAGLSAGASAATSLLSAPVTLVLWLWLLRRRPRGARLSTSVSFLAGGLIPFLPLLWLTVRAPRQVLFDILLYHLFYRNQGRPTIQHDLSVLARWPDSATGMLLALLGLVGLLCAYDRRDWEAGSRRELSLCAWLIAALTLLAVVAHPTLVQYFVLLIPFAAILAAVGVYAVGSSQLVPRQRRRWLALVAAAPFLVEPARAANQLRGGARSTWQLVENVARHINVVTPRDGVVKTHEDVYVAARQLPVAGLESSFALELSLTPPQAEALHIVSRRHLEEWLRAGRFDTVSNCESGERSEHERSEPLDLRSLYAEHARIWRCDIYWQKVAQ